jgi:hypothetical protein
MGLDFARRAARSFYKGLDRRRIELGTPTLFTQEPTVVAGTRKKIVSAGVLLSAEHGKCPAGRELPLLERALGFGAGKLDQQKKKLRDSLWEKSPPEISGQFDFSNTSVSSKEFRNSLPPSSPCPRQSSP